MSLLKDLFSAAQNQNMRQSGLIVVGTPVEEPTEAQDVPVEEPQVPQREYVTPTLNIHYVPRSDEREGLVFINYETNEIDAFFNEYAIDIEFNEPAYHASIWSHQVTQTSPEYLFTFSIDNNRIPTCKFFAPSSKETSDGAIAHPEYPYYNTVEIPVCLNPELALMNTWNRTVYDVCQVPVQEHCPKYSAHEWVESMVAYPTENTTLRAELNYLGQRVLHGRIVSVFEDQITIVYSTRLESEQDVELFTARFTDEAGTAEVVTTGREIDVPVVTAEPVKFLPKLVATKVA